MPNNPPSQPPSAPSIARNNSGTRVPEREARHLSKPNVRNVTALNAANQMAANESDIFKRGLFNIPTMDWRVNSPMIDGCPARPCSESSGVRDRRTSCYATEAMVAREGSAPSASRCRPDVMLFHHRAVEARPVKVGCLAWICTRSVGVKTRHAAVTPRGNELVEPEVVATSPYPGKNRMPVCCGFDSIKLVLVVRFALALATLSTSCLCWLGYTSKRNTSGRSRLPAWFPLGGAFRATRARRCKIE